VKDAVDRILMTLFITIDPCIYWNIAEYKVRTGHRIVGGNQQSVINNRCWIKMSILKREEELATEIVGVKWLENRALFFPP
jgi:hypothetical protein